MKIIILSLTLVLLTSSSLFSQWNWQYPRPQGNNFRSHWVFNDSSFILGGDAGVIMKTENGGTNWNLKNLSIDNDIYSINDIYFANPNTGYACGALKNGIGFVYKTTDGGYYWNILPISNIETTKVVFFLNPSLGWVSNDTSYFITTDGGNTWQSNSLPILEVKNIVFMNAQIGFMSGTGIVKTTDGGNTWKKVCNAGVKKIYIYDFLLGWAITEQNILYRTTDGGETWTGYNSIKPLSVLFTETNNNLFAITKDGCSQQSNNGGESWGSNCSYGVANFYNGFFLDANNAFVYRASTLWHTNHYGDTWNSIFDENSGKKVSSIYFEDSLIGWSCGNGIMKTTDGGNNWNIVYYNINLPNEKYNDIKPFGVNHIIAVGDVGDIKYSTDNGGNWTNNNYSSVKLNAVDMIDSHTGLICGDNGLILKTTDAGLSWHSTYTGTTSNLKYVKCLSSEVVYCGGVQNISNESNLLKSSDWGTTWYSVSDDFISNSNSIYFKDSLNAFAVGKKDTIVKTTDGGIHWTLIGLNTIYGLTLNKIFFINSRIGWICGDNGLVLKTSNGGENWYEQKSSTVNKLLDVFALDSNRCWIAGENTIFSTINGGGIMGIDDNLNYDIPSTYYLSQNYPNPFNPSTTINYEVSKLSRVTITVTNLLGQEVARLVDETKQVGGYTLNWKADGLPSGVYYYRMMAGDRFEVKKMNLVK